MSAISDKSVIRDKSVITHKQLSEVYLSECYGHIWSKDATGAGHLFDINQSESCQNGLQYIKFWLLLYPRHVH